MSKIVNTFLLIVIIIFFVSAFRFYSSKKNIEVKNYNRNNINFIINSKISNLPIIENDTDNVIIFNDGLSNINNNDKPRSFWNLLKFK